MKLQQLLKNICSSLCISGTHNYANAQPIYDLYHSVKKKRKKFIPQLCGMVNL